MKVLILLTVALALILTGCVTTGDVKDQVLIPLTDKVFMEVHDQNIRSYHIKVSKAVVLDALAIEIFGLNGVQDVIIMAYRLSVMVSPLFKWEDIEPEILKILKQ